MLPNITDPIGEDDSEELTSEKVIFVAELVWEVIPPTEDRAKPKRIIAENAENHYVRNKAKYTDAILTATKKKDWWVRSSYINTHWRHIKDYLADTGRVITRQRGRGSRGCYATIEKELIQKDYDMNYTQIKKMGDRQSYRAVKLNNARKDLELPVTVVQSLPVLPPGE